jgi:indolepyruvate ferredoxin oxidoreductase alpha subunit
MKNINAIDSLSFGLLDGGCKVFTNFPGYKSHELFSKLGGKITSINEKTAYEIAWGSSFAGKRSAVMFKNVGLNDAADPFLNSMIVGVNAGLVVIVFDDMFVEGSQSRQDSRHYFDFFGGLWFEPYSIQNAYDVSYKSFALSEKFKIPVVIRVTNQLVNQIGTCARKKGQNKLFKHIYNHKRFVVHPINSKYQNKQLIKKNIQIQKYVDSLYRNLLSTKKSNLFVFGCCSIEEEKYQKGKFNKTQFFTYPLPKKICKLVACSEKTVVLEQGDSYGFQKIQELGCKGKLESNTGFIPDKSSGYITSNSYKKLFSAIKEVKPTFVVGDLGEYTKDTLDTIDACLCLGSSVGVGMGCILAGGKRVITVTGDASYLHTGKNSLSEAIERKTPLKLIILCNGGSQVTGGQKAPGDLFYQPKEVETFKVKYEQINRQGFKKILNTMFKSKFVSVLYVLMKI